MDGDALFTSQMKDMPSACRLLSNGNPVRLGRTLAPSMTSSMGLTVRSKFTRRRVSATMSSRMVIRRPP